VIHFDVAHILIGLILGALIGAAGGLFGIGGGLLAIPILGLFFGLDQQHAQGTAMLMVAPNVMIGLYNYARRGKMNARIAIALALSAVPFTYLGAHIATHIASAPLRRGFAIFLIGIACVFVWRALRGKPTTAADEKKTPWPAAIPIGIAGGMLSGLFSVGGAVFAVPVLSIVFGIAQAAAQGLGLALVAPGTLVGLYAYIAAGDVVWPLAIPLAIAGMLTVSYGVGLAYKLPEKTLRVLFAVLIFLSAAALWFKV
jgi:uncharacterized membrane protein YfcA